MLKIQTLASGSRGNCTFVSSETTQILIDIGLGPRVLAKRMMDACIYPNKIDAVLITHEHSDHISGVGVFARRSECMIYIHEEAKECFTREIGPLPQERIRTFSEPFLIGDITVEAFPIPHDSEFCYGYIFTCGENKISLATDLGVCCTNSIDKMAGSQIVMLECNHCTIKLANNVKYPIFLKKRISSNVGHLSNVASAKAILRLACLGTRQVILAHLSQENNTPTLARTVVQEFLEKQGLQVDVDIKISVAAQNEIGERLGVL